MKILTHGDNTIFVVWHHTFTVAMLPGLAYFLGFGCISQKKNTGFKQNLATVLYSKYYPQKDFFRLWLPGEHG